MSTLVPAKPIGINTDFISDKSITLTAEAGYLGTADTFLLEDGTPFIKVDRDLLSASRRMYFTDMKSDKLLFEMTKESFHYRYSADHPDGSGSKLFEIDIVDAFMGGPTANAIFVNAAGYGETVQLEYKVHTFDNVNTIVSGGQPVAEVQKPSYSTPGRIILAPNVDPLPVIAMLMALNDRARKKKKGTGGIGNNGDFFTANMGTAAWQGVIQGAAGKSI